MRSARSGVSAETTLTSPASAVSAAASGASQAAGRRSRSGAWRRGSGRTEDGGITEDDRQGGPDDKGQEVFRGGNFPRHRRQPCADCEASQTYPGRQAAVSRPPRRGGKAELAQPDRPDPLVQGSDEAL